MRTPIQIVVIRDPDNDASNPYVDTLRLAFEGSAGEAGSPDTYIGDAIDLGIRVLDVARNRGLEDEEVDRLTSGARYTVVVLFGDCGEKWKYLLGKECVVRLDVEEPEDAEDGEEQGKSVVAGVERRLAAVATTLRAMEKARQALCAVAEKKAQVGPGSGAGIKLFISHAKIDGVPVALSLVSMLLRLREESRECAEGGEDGDGGFEYFYDVEDLETGKEWQPVLEQEASQGLLIALRTEAYEERYWCQREFLLAESNRMPILVVDLRTEQYQDSGLLPFEAAPTVRVHDGNLIRVVLHALAAHMRALRVAKVAHASVCVLPHRPSVHSLAAVREAGGYDQIAYPGPKLAEAYVAAVGPLLGKDIELVTYDEMKEAS